MNGRAVCESLVRLILKGMFLMIQVSRILSIALSVVALGPMAVRPLLAFQSSMQQKNWGNLVNLAHGDEIRIVAHGGPQRGTFQSVTDDAITVHFATGDQTFARQRVDRVLVKRDGRRGKHTLIGLAIGTGAGFALGAAADHPNNRHQFDPLPNAGKAVGTTIGALVGTGIGALFPASGWMTIYEVH
jgi:hypothetical protein